LNNAPIGDHNKFIVLLGKFLQNQANQFGFARAARVMNGVVSPSNCTLDGRWIDLNSCGMVNGGVNYSIKSQFYTEHDAPLTYAVELLHAYSKYNNVYLTPEPLIDYYREQFFAYFQHHIGFVLGYSSQLSPQTSEEWKAIALCFYRVIHSGKTVVTERSVFNDTDPVFALIKGLYLSLFSTEAAAPNYDMAGITDENEKNTLSVSFKKLMENTFVQHKPLNGSISESLSQFIITSFVCAMKRAYYSAIFYLPLLEGQVRRFCDGNKPGYIESFINMYCDTADWVYDRQMGSLVLFKSKYVTICISTELGVYSVIEGEKNSREFHSFPSLINFVHTELKDALWICGFNGVYFFDALLSMFNCIEKHEEMLGVAI
jgi:hypothetical protein